MRRDDEKSLSFSFTKISPFGRNDKKISKRFIFFCYVIWDKFMIFLL
jgi:hypothetical protein